MNRLHTNWARGSLGLIGLVAASVAMITLARDRSPVAAEGEAPMKSESTAERTELATFAAGCFWCIEEAFQQQPGVIQAVSGYTGGRTPNPTYREVCTGQTGHAEAVQVTFDPARISYEQLLALFWKLHDPTQLNRQGADVGTQYRSAIFYHGAEQQRLAEKSLEEESISGRHLKPIVTEIVPAPVFYPAEKDHQEYYRRNKSAPYCRAVIQPKLRALGLEP